MAKNGVPGMVKEIRDSAGNTFVFEKKNELGRGAQGAVYLGKVASLGSSSANINVGDEVAIKVVEYDPAQRFDGVHRYAATQREIECLNKKGELLAAEELLNEDGTRNICIVMPYYTGKNLREVMYELEGDYQKIVGKKPLTMNEKNQIAYGLLRTAAENQQAGIVYADYKPDHILVDLEKEKISIIDFGQSFLLLEGTPYENEGFQDSGWIYRPPEAGTLEGGQTVKNDFQTDGYLIGIMIAALYSDTCYELEVLKIKHTAYNNASLLARETLLDVLGDDVKSKAGMPQDLFDIVRHLTKTDPQDRPFCIALANGIESSPLFDLKEGNHEILVLLESFQKKSAQEAAQKEAISQMLSKLEELAFSPSPVEDDKKKGKKKAKAGKGFFIKRFKSTPSTTHEVDELSVTLKDFKSAPANATEQVHQIHKLVSVALKSLKTTRDFDNIFPVLEQLLVDIAKGASVGKFPRDQASYYIQEISNMIKNFSSLQNSSASASSSSSSRIKPF